MDKLKLIAETLKLAKDDITPGIPVDAGTVTALIATTIMRIEDVIEERPDDAPKARSTKLAVTINQLQGQSHMFTLGDCFSNALHYCKQYQSLVED